MPTKIRLQRHGRKSYAFFHIVVADSRAPRDGKNIEKLGVYNPNTNPATIEIDFDSTLNWLENGAQPTDTCRAILSYKGVLYKKHLQGGVKKGAFTQEEADARFEKWMSDKTDRIEKGADAIAKAKEAELKKQLEAEAAVKAAIADKVAAKNSPLSEEVEAATTEEATAEGEEVAVAEETAPAVEAVTETAVEEAPAVEEEAPATEEVAPEVEAEAAPEVETPTDEASAEEAPVAEATDEAPAAEAEESTAEEEEKKEGE